MATQDLQTQAFEDQASVPHASMATESSDKNDLSASPQTQTWINRNYSSYDEIKHGMTGFLSRRTPHERFGRSHARFFPGDKGMRVARTLAVMGAPIQKMKPSLPGSRPIS